MKPTSHLLRVAIDGRLMHYRRAGIGLYTRRLVQAMAAEADQSAVRLHILLDRRDADTTWVPSSVRILRTVTPAHHRAEPVALPLELAALSVRAGGFDVVHFPDFIACAGPFKKIITIHDLYFMEHPEVMSPDAAHYYGQIRTSAQRADRIIAVSAFTRQDVLRLLPQVAPDKVALDKVAVVHEAADVAVNRTTETTAITAGEPSAEGEAYALFVGTFEPRKNLNTLFAALAQTAPPIKLVIVGEAGWVDNEPARLAESLGLRDRITFTGRVSDDALDKLYRQARVFVFPSWSEGFGLPVLEAMARGVPVVCSAAGALPEVAGEAALFHAPQDANALAAHLNALWADAALRDDYRQRGLQRAAQFSWQRAAEQTLHLYRQTA